MPELPFGPPGRLLRVPFRSGACGELAESREAALRAPLGEIVLAHCLSCGFTFNRCFDPGLVDFKPGYDASLVYSDTFRSFLEDVAGRLIGEFGVHGKNVVEIGCGKGFFLRLLCERGENDGVGIDLTVVEECVEFAGSRRIQWIRDFFGERYETLHADFVCCLSVFEGDRKFRLRSRSKSACER